jgi:hypothetical protein
MDPGKDNIWDVITAKQSIQKRMADRMDRMEHQTRQAQPNVPRSSTKKKPEDRLTGAKIVLVVIVIYMIFQALVAGLSMI